MLKYSIEAQDTDGTYTEVADRTRRFADALTSLEALTGEGTYRVRFGRFVKTEKVVVEDSPLVVSQFGVGDVVRTPRGTRDGQVWKVEDGVLFYRSLDEQGGMPINSVTRKVSADKAKLVRKAAAPKAA